MSKYLLEVGCEELPYKFIPSAIKQLKDSFENFLNTNKAGFDKVEVYATPRRLAVIISGLDKSSKDEEKIIKGPIKKVAYDEKGNLTKAGEGFCRKNGLTQDDLYLENDYLYAKIVVKGKSIVELLQENVPSVILRLQGSHFMRWSDNEEKFSRPIRWIVSILDNEEVKIKIIDKISSNITRGHRFSKQNIVINSPDEYVDALRNACVIVNQEERRQLIIDSAKQEAKNLNAQPYYTDDLLEEVTFITEYPVPVVCEFNPDYLRLPQELVVTVMAVHQRYFALFDESKKLINKFITMTNYLGNEFENIKAGNVRVIKARLDDAVFFFNEDTKKPLESYVEDIKGITFQKGMGSMYDKAQRLIKLSKFMIGENQSVERTALLAKADLATKLVFEFTELQGFIGADYARVSSEEEQVAEGIKEHYFPLNADGEIAKTLEGQIVGIADKIDNICAVFTEGKKPTGSSDPLGVRRASLGVIRTVLENQLDIDLTALIKESLKLLSVYGFENNNIENEISEFFVQRLIIFLSDKYSRNILDACASNKNPLKNLVDYVLRVDALAKFNAPQVLESANRVLRILKEDSTKQVDKTLFKEPVEELLYQQVCMVNAQNYEDYLQQLVNINPVVEKFFNDVLVMDKCENVKENRLALLTLLKLKYTHIADFSKL